MPLLPKNDERVDIRVPHDDVAYWRTVAAAENMTFSDWIRRACRTSAEVFEKAKGRRRR